MCVCVQLSISVCLDVQSHWPPRVLPVSGDVSVGMPLCPWLCEPAYVEPNMSAPTGMSHLIPPSPSLISSWTVCDAGVGEGLQCMGEGRQSVQGTAGEKGGTTSCDGEGAELRVCVGGGRQRAQHSPGLEPARVQNSTIQAPWARASKGLPESPKPLYTPWYPEVAAP